jgi:cytochrome c-type biogenesis protein CcmF
VGPPFVNPVTGPLGLALLALTGIGPLIAWRRASVANLKRQFTGPVVAGIVTGAILVALGMRHWWAVLAYVLAAFVFATIVQEFQKGMVARHRMYGESYPVAFFRLVGRNRRRYGGYIVHVGIVMLFAAFAGLAFKEEFDISIQGGQSYEAVDPYGDRWRFVSQGVSRYEELNRQTTAVLLEASRNGKRVGIIKSEKRQYVDSNGNPTFEPSSVVGILGGLRQDVYVVLAGVRGEDVAEMRITFNPLVWWVWYGGVIMAIGGIIVMWPRAERRKPHEGYATVLEPAGATAEGARS